MMDVMVEYYFHNHLPDTHPCLHSVTITTLYLIVIPMPRHVTRFEPSVSSRGFLSLDEMEMLWSPICLAHLSVFCNSHPVLFKLIHLPRHDKFCLLGQIEYCLALGVNPGGGQHRAMDTQHTIRIDVMVNAEGCENCTQPSHPFF